MNKKSDTPCSCPFCGSRHSYCCKTASDYDDKELNGWAVHCPTCGARGPIVKTRWRSVREWNDLRLLMFDIAL